MRTQRVDGDLLDQPVDVIVNGWNRNPLPWWLVAKHGFRSVAFPALGSGAGGFDEGRSLDRSSTGR